MVAQVLIAAALVLPQASKAVEPTNARACGKAGNSDDDDRGYAATRDAIKRHVEQLVDTLLKQQR